MFKFEKTVIVLLLLWALEMIPFSGVIWVVVILLIGAGLKVAMVGRRLV